MPGRLRIRSVFVVAVAIGALDSQPSAQAQSDYLSLVRSHIDGGVNAAAEMARLPRAAIDAGLRTCLGKDRSGIASGGVHWPCRPSELKSAALLHADALDFLVVRDPNLAAFHVEAGARMLGPLETGDATFVARWYAYVARICLANRDINRARSIVADGLRRFESPDLYVARGMVTAQRSSTVIHVVRFGTEPFLARLADETGGRTWRAGSDRQLEELFTRALDEMRARYVLTYSVHAPNKPGWHRIQVGLRNARGDVTARPGYVAR